MVEQVQTKKSRRGWKIAIVSMIALGVIGGAVGAATAGPGMNNAKDTVKNTSTTQASPTVSGTDSATTAAPTTSSAAPSPSPKPTSSLPASTVLFPAAGTTYVNPGAPVTATVKNGTVFSAVLKDSLSGKEIKGELSNSNSKWENADALKFNTNYSFVVTSEDGAGVRSTTESNFSTVPPTHEADLVMYPAGGAAVGVAQPLQFTFSEPVITPEAKLKVEKAITIKASSGQKGAFRWYSDTLLRYRPETFWKANSNIVVDMKLFGVEFGNGQIGNFNKTNTVRIGDKIEMLADAKNFSVGIYINDKLHKNYKVTMGDAAFPSASGYLVLMDDRQRYATFVASTIGLKPGDPGDYGRVDVEYATRLANSGIFIHQATESAMPYVGQANLSHGCIGMTPEGAKWVFDNMGPGDIVRVINSPNETIAPTDGFGDWNIPFAQYAAR